MTHKNRVSGSLLSYRQRNLAYFGGFSRPFLRVKVPKYQKMTGVPYLANFLSFQMVQSNSPYLEWLLNYSHFCRPNMAKISILVFWANLEVIFRAEGVKISKNRWHTHVREFSLLSESKIRFPVAQTVVELLTIFYTLPPKSGFLDFRIINA